MTAPSPSVSLLRFHLRAGIRVCLRSMVPVIGLISAASLIYGDLLIVPKILASVTFPPSISLFASSLLFLAAYALAVTSSDRIAHGLDGWIRHLPATGVDQRRAATGGLAIGLAPLLTLFLIAGALVWPAAPSVTAARLAALPVVAWAAALVSLRVANGAVRPLAAAGALLAGAGSWLLLLLGSSIVLLAEHCAGPTRDPGPRRTRWRRADWVPMQLRIAWRALGWRLVGNALLPVLCFGPALFFIVNNELSPTVEVGAIRLAALLAAAAAVIASADLLARRRPPWPWLRSLPLTAASRVGSDVALLASAGLPAMIAATIIRPSALAPCIAVLPFLAWRGASAIRHPFDSSQNALLQLSAETIVPVVLTTLFAPAAILFLVLTPAAAAIAAHHEQRHDVSRWNETQHASSDWSDQ